MILFNCVKQLNDVGPRTMRTAEKYWTSVVVGDDDDDMDEKFQQRKENDSEEKDNDGSEDGDSDEGSDSDGDSDSDTTEYPDDDAVGIIRNMSGYPRDEAPETRLEAVERHLDYTEEQHM